MQRGGCRLRAFGLTSARAGNRASATSPLLRRGVSRAPRPGRAAPLVWAIRQPGAREALRIGPAWPSPLPDAVPPTWRTHRDLGHPVAWNLGNWRNIPRTSPTTTCFFLGDALAVGAMTCPTAPPAPRPSARLTPGTATSGCTPADVIFYLVQWERPAQLQGSEFLYNGGASPVPPSRRMGSTGLLQYVSGRWPGPFPTGSNHTYLIGLHGPVQDLHLVTGSLPCIGRAHRVGRRVPPSSQQNPRQLRLAGAEWIPGPEPGVVATGRVQQAADAAPTARRTNPAWTR